MVGDDLLYVFATCFMFSCVVIIFSFLALVGLELAFVCFANEDYGSEDGDRYRFLDGVFFERVALRECLCLLALVLGEV